MFILLRLREHNAFDTPRMQLLKELEYGSYKIIVSVFEPPECSKY